MLRVEQARKLLSPFLSPDHRTTARKMEARFSRKGSQFAAALLTTQLSAFHYRTIDNRAAEHLARLAERLLGSMTEEVSQIDLSIAVSNNRIHLSRILWRQGDREAAERVLQAATDLIMTRLSRVWNASAEPRPKTESSANSKGGLLLQLAFALDLGAGYDWVRGNLNEARRKIYQASSILRTDEVFCAPSLAHSLWVCGRVEATASEYGYPLALTWLDESQQGFQSIRHPLYYRVRTQIAQCLAKAGRDDAAQQILDDMKTQEKPRIERGHDSERRFVQAEIHLTRVWIAQASARRTREWSEYLESARELEKAPGKTPRLTAEAKLHVGLGLSRTAGENCRDAAQEALQDALAFATERDYRKIAIGARLGLCESLLSDDRREEAIEHRETASRELLSINSTFLARWADDLGQRLAGPVFFEFDPRAKLDDAIKSFKAHFVAHASQAAKSKKDLQRQLGVSRATVWRILNPDRDRSEVGLNG